MPLLALSQRRKREPELRGERTDRHRPTHRTEQGLFHMNRFEPMNNPDRYSEPTEAQRTDQMLQMVSHTGFGELHRYGKSGRF
jgi:hypothetical protein